MTDIPTEEKAKPAASSNAGLSLGFIVNSLLGLVFAGLLLWLVYYVGWKKFSWPFLVLYSVPLSLSILFFAIAQRKKSEPKKPIPLPRGLLRFCGWFCVFDSTFVSLDAFLNTHDFRIRMLSGYAIGFVILKLVKKRK